MAHRSRGGLGSARAVDDEPAELVRDPSSPHYDAVRLLEAGIGDIQDIYADEPRTEPWASERERAALEYVRQDLLRIDPDARLEADCRTSSCRFRIYSKDARLTSELAAFPFSCMGRLTSADLEMTNEHGAYSDTYVLFDEQGRDHAWYVQNRDATCPRQRDRWHATTR